MKSSEEFLKIINVIGKLYHEDPAIFKIKFRGFYADVKLHNKIRKVCDGDKQQIKHLYAALHKFDEYVEKYRKKYKKVDYQIIYENVSDSYKIPITLLRSAVASRNSFKRDQIN